LAIGKISIDDASRGPSAIAELLVVVNLRICFFLNPALDFLGCFLSLISVYVTAIILPEFMIIVVIEWNYWDCN